MHLPIPFHLGPRLRGALAVGLILPFLYACAGDAGDTTPDETDAMDQPAGEAAQQPPDPGTEMEEPTEHTIELAEVQGSGVSGEATGMHSEDALVVMIELEGLPATGEFAAHVHSGSCSEGGPVAVALDPVIGLADGTGASTTTLEPDEVDDSEPHFVQVHGDGGTPIACGDME